MTLPTPVRALIPLGGAAIVLLVPMEIESHGRRALAIAVAMVLAWVVECVHPALVGFIGAFAFRAAAGVEFETAFAGFSATTPWFLYGALMMLKAAEESGVVNRFGGITPKAFTGPIWPASIAL